MIEQPKSNYPLQWPSGWKRTQGRRVAKFATGNTYSTRQPLTVGKGLDRLYAELNRLGATEIVVSSNMRLGKNGWPLADNQQQPGGDPCVAVYFKLKGKPRCMACDTWTRIADNLASIAGTIEALRAVENAQVESKYRTLAREWHPDAWARATSDQKAYAEVQMSRINEAYAAFRKERGL